MYTARSLVVAVLLAGLVASVTATSYVVPTTHNPIIIVSKPKPTATPCVTRTACNIVKITSPGCNIKLGPVVSCNTAAELLFINNKCYKDAVLTGTCTSAVVTARQCAKPCVVATPKPTACFIIKDCSRVEQRQVACTKKQLVVVACPSHVTHYTVHGTTVICKKQKTVAATCTKNVTVKRTCKTPCPAGH